jgi:hypothetical protein
LNWPRPETHGFTKFVLSLGVFLCVAAFVAPALILRDTGVLLVSEGTLRHLTPVAEEEIRSRQRTAHHLGTIAPFAGLGLLFGGLALVGYGLPRLRRQEGKDDEKSAAELAQLLSALEPQSAEEEEAELEAKVDEESKAKARIREQPSSAPAAEALPIPPAHTYDRAERTARAREVESKVLSRIEEIAPPLYELKARVKVHGPPDLFVDGVLVSKVDQLPDILVEIKLGGIVLSKNIGNRIADALLNTTRYGNRLKRTSIGWLIIVLDQETTAPSEARLAQFAADMGEQIHLTLVRGERISELEFPFPA